MAPPSSQLRGRVVVAAVAVGAFAAAAAGQTLQAGQSPDEVTPLADSSDASAAIGIGGGSTATASAAAPDVLTFAARGATPLESQKIASTNQIVQARAAAFAAAEAERNRPKYVRPAEGRYTSSFGARWGTSHMGIDVANRIGTPILAVADGTVVEAGTASGFGLWVRIEHADGSISVYGHVDTYSVREGQEVRAGEQIARMGNRGFSTGPHLHFEIWDADGRKKNPNTWLNSHGVGY